jgi:hypothetical protein
MPPRRFKKKPEELDPPEAEIERLREELVKFYRNWPKFAGDPIEKSYQIIEQCKKGWVNCPRTFEMRVRTKAGLRNKAMANLMNWGEANSAKAARERAIEQQMNKAFPVPKSNLEQEIDHAGRAVMLKMLNVNDRKFFKQRERYYRKEFDFNSSSDYALLVEVIMDELKIQKIHKMEMAELEKVDPSSERLLRYSKMVTEAHTRLAKSQQALGVTRDQRKDELEDAESNLASISVSLDKKIKAMAAKEAAYAEEEEAGLNRKFLRGDVYPVEGLDRAVHNLMPEATIVDELIADAGILTEEELVDGQED